VTQEISDSKTDELLYRIFVQIKPSCDEDYPAVLQQIRQEMELAEKGRILTTVDKGQKKVQHIHVLFLKEFQGQIDGV
jgi:hypothetical protein